MKTVKRYDYVLPQGFVLQGGKREYVVDCVLGKGGFGVTYIGWDLALEKITQLMTHWSSFIEKYAKMTAWALVDISHKTDPWINTTELFGNKSRISKNSIRKYLIISKD